MDRSLAVIFGAVSVLLACAGVAGAVLNRRATSPAGRATARNFNARTKSWVIMCAILAIAILCGKPGVLLLFAVISFLALREFITLAPTRRADHRTLVWVFFILVPVQTYLLWIGKLGIFLVLVPVYSFLLLAFRSAIVGDTTDYLRRAAGVFWATMICVFCIGHAPALMLLKIDRFDQFRNVNLLLFLLIVVQMNDVLQYCWGKLLGRHPLTRVSPNKTWEGFIGGALSASLVGLALAFATPFRAWQAWLFALMIALLGTMGGMVMSAVKRDAGVKDYGQLIDGHGGVMDRIDSLAFAAPVFFHVVRYWFSAV